VSSPLFQSFLLRGGEGERVRVRWCRLPLDLPFFSSRLQAIRYPVSQPCSFYRPPLSGHESMESTSGKRRQILTANDWDMLQLGFDLDPLEHVGPPRTAWGWAGNAPVWTGLNSWKSLSGCVRRNTSGAADVIGLGSPRIACAAGSAAPEMRVREDASRFAPIEK